MHTSQKIESQHAKTPASMKRSATQALVWIAEGNSIHRRTSWGLSLAGFASFSLTFGVQPLLPAFKNLFGPSRGLSGAFFDHYWFPHRQFPASGSIGANAGAAKALLRLPICCMTIWDPASRVQLVAGSGSTAGGRA